MKRRAGITDRFAALAMTGALEGAGVDGIPLADALIIGGFRVTEISAKRRANGVRVVRAVWRNRLGAPSSQIMVRVSVVLKTETT